jgi:hypothetical protein
MHEISLPRVTHLTLWIGAAGTAAAALLWDIRIAAAFLAGALLSLVTIRSWIRFAGMLDPARLDPAATAGKKTRSGLATGIFLVLRYFLFAGVIYVMMKYLGSAPAAILVGLLVSFAAVVLDFFSGTVRSK